MYFRETNYVIYWIVIYPADSIVHLSNSALERREQRSLMSGNPCDKYGETFHSLNATETLYDDAVLEQVTEWVLINEVNSESANQIQKWMKLRSHSEN